MSNGEDVKKFLEVLVRSLFGGISLILCFSLIEVSWSDAAPAFYQFQLGQIVVWLFLYAFIIGVCGWFFLVAMDMVPESRREQLEDRVEELEKKLED